MLIRPYSPDRNHYRYTTCEGFDISLHHGHNIIAFDSSYLPMLYSAVAYFTPIMQFSLQHISTHAQSLFSLLHVHLSVT